MKTTTCNDHSLRTQQVSNSSTYLEMQQCITAMASDISILAYHQKHTVDADQAFAQALDLFREVDRTCTRFCEQSDLMKANRSLGQLTAVHPLCFDALQSAHDAYLLTQGTFDPRIFDDLVALGYAASISIAPLGKGADPGITTRQSPLATWSPTLEAETLSVDLGTHPVDLGGIAKGLAVRWSAAVLDAGGFDAFLINAGGDLFLRGTPPQDKSWRVGIEHPAHPDRHIAVLEVANKGCATSSTRVRQWKLGNTSVHHLINPATGQPGGEGLWSVTVVDDDPAQAEVWSKYLFLKGADGICDEAESRSIPAFWVFDNGKLQFSPSLDEFLLWFEK